MTMRKIHGKQQLADQLFYGPYTPVINGSYNMPGIARMD
jgi:hypothetical protein